MQINTPTEVSHKMKKGDEELVDEGRYEKQVGKLIYLLHSRPGLSYAVILVSQFMHEPRAAHLEAIYRLLSYLKRARGQRNYV